MERFISKDDHQPTEAGWLVLGLLAAIVLAIIIRQLVKMHNRKKAVRFYRLRRIDKYMAKRKPIVYDEQITLSDFCERFRNYAANKLGLYYDIKLIRLFVAGLGTTRMTIIQGISGTGKTSLAYAFGKFVENDTVVIPVQPSWRDRSDLLGYYNEFSKRFTETELLAKVYEAGYSRDVYLTVLDEMNIARVEYYFAEFLSILEMPSPDEWKINVVSDVWPGDPKKFEQGTVRLPVNMWYVGTANNDDSTFGISDKVYDRAMIIDINAKAQPFDAPKTAPVRVSAEHLLKLFAAAAKTGSISEESTSKLEAVDKYLMDSLRISFGNRIMRQLNTFVPIFIQCGGTEDEAIDYIIAKKVLRKLEGQNLMFLQDELDGLIALLKRLYGANGMPECQACLRGMKRRG